MERLGLGWRGRLAGGPLSIRLGQRLASLHLPNRRSSQALAVGLLIAVTFGVSTGIGYWRATPPGPSQSANTVPAAILRAADDLSVRLSGSGVSFEVIQQQTAHAIPGGSPLVDPNGGANAAPTDSLYVARDLSHGFSVGGIFYEEIRGGLAPGDPADWDRASFEYGVLVRDGHVWRSDGSGWREAVRTDIPGLGMDPFSLTKLPHMLQSLVQVSDDGPAVVNGKQVEKYSALADSAGWPGLVASDGITFTSSPITVEVYVSSGNRLERLVGTARNINRTDADLIIRTEATFGDQIPATVPEPSPIQSGASSNVSGMR